MALVEIFVDQAAIDANVADVNAKASALQSIYDDLKTLGVSSPTLQDIASLQGNQVSLAALKALVIRGKTLTISGVQIGSDAIQLNPSLVSTIKAKLNSLSNVQYSYYELADGEISVIESLENDLKPGYTLMGTELAAEIIADAAAICTSINAMLAKVGIHNQHPMRDISNWADWNIGTKTYGVDRHTITKIFN